MPAQPRLHVDAAPLYPAVDAVPLYPVVGDRSPPGGTRVRAWTQSQPGKLGSLARDITILRRGLDSHLQRQRRALVRRRLWIGAGGIGLGLVLIGIVSLFF